MGLLRLFQPTWIDDPPNFQLKPPAALLWFFGFKWNSFRGHSFRAMPRLFFLLLGGVNLLVFFHMLNRNIQIASMKPSIWPHCWWPVPFLLIHSIISIHVRVFLPVFMLNTFNPTFFLVQKMCYPSIPSAGRGNGGGNNGSDRKGTHLLYGKRASAASDLLGRSSGAGKGWKCWNASFTTYKWIYK